MFTIIAMNFVQEQVKICNSIVFTLSTVYFVRPIPLLLFYSINPPDI